MSTIPNQRPPIDGYLLLMIIITLAVFAVGILSSCRAYKPDGSPTWNTRQLMKKDSAGVMTGHGYRAFKKDQSNTVKK